MERGRWNLALRRAQEALELVLKALLILMGVEYPKEHDPSKVFVDAGRRRGLAIPETLAKEIQELSAELVRKHAPTFYAEILMSEEDAWRAVEGVREVWELAREWRERLE